MKKAFLLNFLVIIFFSMTQAKNPLLGRFNTPRQTVPFGKIKTEHYESAFESAIKKHEAEISAITNNKAVPTFVNTIEALEYSGKDLGRVSLIFFNLLSAESSDEMMAISQIIQPKLTEHSNNINLNGKLFERVKAVYDEKENLMLNIEQKRLLDKTYDGFINSGAGLSPENKQKYRELSMKLNTLTLEFGQNVLKATNAYELLLTNESQLEGLPRDIRDAAALKARSKGKTGWLIDLTAPSYVPFMKYSSDRELRKELYIASTTKCTGGEFNNMDKLRDIVNTRLEISKLMGYETYADQILRRRMAVNKDNVYKLLEDLLKGYEASALREYREVQGFAIGFENKNMVVMPYDWNYYSEKLKDRKFDLNDEMVRPYFELENVKKGVFGLATELYGITFKRNTKIPVYHPEVDAYEVFDQNGEYLAVLYTDFHPRAGKRPGAWMTEYQGQEIRGGENIRPHVTIVMNFTRPTDSKPALLTFDEVETFLHEFGHALHGMFANTTYPGLSGTNVYRDFVELPSQIMENFLLEKTYLDQFAVHYETGEKIPEELIKKIVDASNFNVGYLCLRQLSFGLLDMAYHTLTEPYAGGIQEFEYKATSATTVVPIVEGSVISPAFSHIFSGGYAAGYYSYKWSEVLDADAYALFKEKGIFNKDVARSFRENVLSKGGTENPMTLYIRFRGQEPTIDALLERSGVKR
jgi:peptidyl-dipeptidase Dcp